MKDLFNYEIDNIERFGGRCSERILIGKCGQCRQAIYTSDAELCCDGGGNNFCSLTCFLKFYKYKEGWSEKLWHGQRV